MQKHILLPLDGSETSKNAVAQAKTYAQAFLDDDLKITFLYVISHPEGEMMTNGSIMMQNAIEAEKEKGIRMLEAYKEGFDEALLDKIEVAVEMGPVSNVIIDYVKMHNVSHVVMGSQGLGSSMRRLLVGSVAKKVLTNVEVPVLVVR